MLLIVLLLSGCTRLSVNDPLPPRATSPDGLRAPSLQVEPIYLSLAPTIVPRNQTYRYACIAGQFLSCTCLGKLGDCECQCEVPFDLGW